MGVSRKFFVLVFCVAVAVLCPKAHAALEVICEWGKDVDVSPFEVVARFQSQLPKLEHHTLKKVSGGKTEPHESEIWISKEKVCGVPVNFPDECRAQLKTFQGDYYWKFDCGKRVGGELSFEQGSGGEGMIHLTCKGEEVLDKNQKRVILGCKKVPSL